MGLRILAWSVGSLILGVASLWGFFWFSLVWPFVVLAWCVAAGWTTARAAMGSSGWRTAVGMATAVLSLALIAGGLIGFLGVLEARCGDRYECPF